MLIWLCLCKDIRLDSECKCIHVQQLPHFRSIIHQWIQTIRHIRDILQDDDDDDEYSIKHFYLNILDNSKEYTFEVIDLNSGFTGFIKNTTEGSGTDALPIVPSEDAQDKDIIFMKTDEFTFTTTGKGDTNGPYWQVSSRNDIDDLNVHFNGRFNEQQSVKDQMRIVFTQSEDIIGEAVYDQIFPMYFVFSDSNGEILSTNEDNTEITISTEDKQIRFDVNPYTDGGLVDVQATNGVQIDVLRKERSARHKRTKCTTWFLNPKVNEKHGNCTIELIAEQPRNPKIKLSSDFNDLNVHRGGKHGNFIAISLSQKGYENYYLQRKPKSNELIFKPYKKSSSKPPMHLYTRRFPLGQTRDVFYLSTSSGKTEKNSKESELKDEFVVFIDSTDPQNAHIKLSQSECTYFCMSI